MRYRGLVGHLVTVESITENAIVLDLAAGQSWLGGGDPVTEGSPTWLTGPQTNQSLDYTNWGSPEDGVNLTTSDCFIMLANGRWSYRNCGGLFPFVVEYEG